MQTERLRQGGIDYDDGVRRFMGRADLYERLLAKFPGDGTFERIQEDYRKNDMERLLGDVHELKGLSGNIALTRLYGSADQLVALLRGGSVAQAELTAAYELLGRDYAAANEAILAAMEE